ncbi:MAG: hypothetical protein JWN40_3987 [Phycisphaerales bacterium]|nr:hypothetical protein [Phycisphaerales bacterium]
MNGFLDSLMGNDLAGSAAGGPEAALLALLLAFCIGHVVAWVYMWTHSGMSYSQMFTASLLVLPVLVAFVMVLMASNVLIALGLLAVFSMIRFRNVLKDTRDTTFVLWAIAEGVACGTLRFGIAVTACITLALIFVYIRVTSFGGRHRYDVILSLEWAGNGDSQASIKPILRRHSLHANLASQHDLDADKIDLSYRLLLRDPSRSRELLKELQATQGVARVSIFHRADEAEV